MAKQSLVIVESPAKAKTIGKYLGKDYEVKACMGHLRDLQKSKLSVDVDNDFEPVYKPIKGKEAIISDLKKSAKAADTVYLATDPDREGEAISWHLANILGLDPHEPNRVTFDEITKKGVKEGMAHPRAIDEDLFNAQQARRVLDRLVGYKLSPFLWRKVRRGLSAGRVQSVAVRLIDDREKEIENFKPDEYWNVDATLGAGHKSFTARLATDSKGKKLLPKAFSNENHIEEVKGVYVPFWLYDGSAEVDVRCHGTKVSGYSTARENVTVTNHYDVRRAGTVRFERVPVDASSKMPDDHMDAIEPFDYKELKPFSTAYLPGFLADKYDVSVQDCADRADSRCETSAVELMEQDARGDYTSCTVESKNVTLHRGKVHYALMPVWLLSTKWNGKSFLFAMNGQTGKLVGDLPLDKGLYWKHFAAITGLCMLGVMAAGLLLSL